MIVVSDSSPIILMAKLGSLSILQKLYKTILIPEGVYSEAIAKGKQEGYADAFLIEKEIGNFIFVKKIAAKFITDLNALKGSCGIGEAEAIIICMQEKADLLLMDDYEPRKIAESKGIMWLSSPGILLTALEKEFINLETYSKKIGDLAKYSWLSGDVVARFLEAGHKLKGGRNYGI